MKKISEMTIEELQDYALKQDEKIKGLEQSIVDKDNEIASTTELNKQLQKRNNELFLKVEQQVHPEQPEQQEDGEEIPSYDDLVQDFVGGKY